MSSLQNEICLNQENLLTPNPMYHQLLQLHNFLNVNNWCRGYWYKDANNQATLSAPSAKKFDILGAIGYLFSGKDAQKIKGFLEAQLQVNAPYFMPELFIPPKKREDGTLAENQARTDYFNLAKFNDEGGFARVNAFLKSAVEAA